MTPWIKDAAAQGSLILDEQTMGDLNLFKVERNARKSTVSNQQAPRFHNSFKPSPLGTRDELTRDHLFPNYQSKRQIKKSTRNLQNNITFQNDLALMNMYNYGVYGDTNQSTTPKAVQSMYE